MTFASHGTRHNDLFFIQTNLQYVQCGTGTSPVDATLYIACSQSTGVAHTAGFARAQDGRRARAQDGRRARWDKDRRSFFLNIFQDCIQSLRLRERDVVLSENAWH